MTATSNRTEIVRVRISPEGRTKIDELRGTWTRSEWMRRAMARAADPATPLRGPQPTKAPKDVEF